MPVSGLLECQQSVTQYIPVLRACPHGGRLARPTVSSRNLARAGRRCSGPGLSLPPQHPANKMSSSRVHVPRQQRCLVTHPSNQPTTEGCTTVTSRYGTLPLACSSCCVFSFGNRPNLMGTKDSPRSRSLGNCQGSHPCQDAGDPGSASWGPLGPGCPVRVQRQAVLTGRECSVVVRAHITKCCACMPQAHTTYQCSQL
jgi:hypothetical protein